MVWKRGFAFLVATTKGWPVGWESRKGGRYYYRRTWVNGRRVKEYAGTGVVAELAAQVDEVQRLETRAAEAEAKTKADRRRRMEQEADRSLVRLAKASDAAAAEVLQAAGYHRHRHQWRKRRMPKAQAKSESKAITPVLPQGAREAADWVAKATKEEMSAAVTLGGNGDKKALPALRAIYAAKPPGVANFDAWGRLGDQGSAAQEAWVDLAAEGNPAIVVATEKRLEAEQAALAGPDANPLQAILAQRITLCRLQADYADKRATEIKSGVGLAVLESRRRQQERANRMLIRSVEAFARVQRLLRGVAVQVNVAVGGPQQVNNGAA